MIRCVVIDDQPEAVKLISTHIGNNTNLELINSFTNPLLALDFVCKNQIDLIFIDIEMPEITGMDFIEMLGNKKLSKMPKFIVITGYDQYALQGFEHGVVDYLMKPVGLKRFTAAVDRYINEYASKTEEKILEYFFVEVNNNKVKIHYDDLIFVEAGGNYITLNTSTSKNLVYKSLSSISEILPANKFVRIHKSFIVSVKHIEMIQKSEICFLRAGGKTYEIPIGGAYKDQLLTILKV